MAKISVVGPVYNEEEGIAHFYRELAGVCDRLPYEAEFIFVDDGSRDRTAAILKELRQADERVKIIRFSRNFGHQTAIKAGIDHASGDAVIVMDTDLQDPPQAIPDLIEKWREGHDVVYATRIERQGETWLKKAACAVYYRLIKGLSSIDLPLDSGDFRLVSRPVADVLKAAREQKPFLRGLSIWAGSRQIGVPIRRAPRFKGETKYPFHKLMDLAWSGITQFSYVPLYFGFWAGLAAFAAAAAAALAGGSAVLVAVLALGGAQLVAIGMVGIYLARTHDQVRARPLYLIREIEGIELPLSSL